MITGRHRNSTELGTSSFVGADGSCGGDGRDGRPPGTSGVLTHIYTVEVDHDFRRWLTAIGKFTWGDLDYQGNPRRDKIYTVSGEAIYKMNRNLWLRGTLRRDWLDSNLPGNSTVSTVVMLGVRVQN